MEEHMMKIKQWLRCRIGIMVIVGLTAALSTGILFPAAPGGEQDEAVSHSRKGDEYYSQGKYKEAMDEFKQALTENPADFALNKRLGLSYLNSGAFDQAISQFNAALLIKPGDTDTLINIGIANSAAGRIRDAIDLYNQLLDGDPNNVWFLYKKAEALSWAKKYDESIQTYRRILELEPQNNGVRIMLAEVYAWQANEEKKPALLKQSISELEGVVRADPRNALAHLKLGGKYLENMELKKAQTQLEKAYRLNPGIDTRILLADVYGRLGKHGKALDLYKQVLTEKPNDIGALYLTGEILTGDKKYNEAAANFEKILKLEPGNIGARWGLARIKAIKGNYLEARAEYEQILKREPGNKAALWGLDELSRRQRR